MTLQEVIYHLPTEPPAKMWHWAETMVGFDTEYLIFRQETVYAPKYSGRGTQLEDLLSGEIEMIPRRGAVCTCTVCGESFETGWASNPRAKMKGITVSLQENGMWPGYCEPDDEFAYSLPEGETLNCPYCECAVQLVHKTSFGDSRTFQIMLGNVGTIGPYAVITTWLYRRVLFDDGRECRDIRPAKAYVVTERGNLQQYSHVKQSGYGGTYDLPQWERVRVAGEDPFLGLYYNYDACNHKQIGGLMWDVVPSLRGTTAEKTGLEEYLLCGGHFPVAYLQEWKKHPYIENLIKAGFGGQVAADFSEQINNHISYGNRSGRVHIEWANLSKAKPSEQLGMTKKEVRSLSEYWDVPTLENWAHYHYYAGQITATEYERHRRIIGDDALKKLTAYASELSDEGWLDKAARYVDRQTIDGHHALAAEHLCDLWDMLEERSGREAISDREWWPRDLRAAHDRECLRLKAAKNAEIDLHFAKVAEKYAALEWNDGELCIRIPRSNEELEKEGRVLRHCVGCYGTRHTEEKVIVFFVRHHRRPERSYYTMDYTFGEKGGYVRNQLHGYGNEHHGENKQYSHRIPHKVTAFVERWEREVLQPWLAAHMISNKKPTKKSA